MNNKPDAILISDIGNGKAFAINLWLDGSISLPEPGNAAEMFEVIEYFKRNEGFSGCYIVGWLPYWFRKAFRDVLIAIGISKLDIISVYIVQRGSSVAKADAMVKEYLRKVKEAISA